MASFRHPGFCTGLRGLGPAVPAAPPGCSDSLSVDSSVYGLHCHRASFKRPDVFTSGLDFFHVAPVSGVKEGEMRLLPLELKEKAILFGGYDHRLWSQQTWIRIPTLDLGQVSSMLRASVASS